MRGGLVPAGVVVDSGSISTTAQADGTDNGTYKTPATKVSRAGCYSYVETVNTTAKSGSASSAAGDVTETSLVVALPTVSTQVSAQSVTVGGTLSDTVTVAGLLNGEQATVGWSLLGPVTPFNGGCANVSWTTAAVAASGSITTATGSGNGSYSTGATTVSAAGCYTYTEVLTLPNVAGTVATLAGDATETAIVFVPVVPTPGVVTTISTTAPVVGSTLSDSVLVSGTGGASISGTWALLGPVAPVTGSCAGVDWTTAPTFDSGTLPVTKDGQYTTASSTKLAAPGCYTFIDALPATATTAAVAPTPGLPLETAQVVSYSVGDYVWSDTNGNGVQDSGEQPVSGVSVTLEDAGVMVGVTSTDSTGLYHFDDLAPGTYTVVFTNIPSGFTFTAPTAPGSSPQNDSNPDATGTSAPLRPGPPAAGNNVTASVPGDRVTAPYIDRTIDAGIVAVPVVPAILTPTVSTQISATTVSVGSTLSDSVSVSGTGGASITGTWELRGPVAPVTGSCAGVDWATAPTFDSGTLPVTKDGQYTTASSAKLAAPGCYTFIDALPATATTAAVAPTPGLPLETAQVVSYSVGDYVWSDTNGNGVQDSGELPVSGVSVTLEDAGVMVGVTSTDSTGLYHFDDLAPGTYTVVFTNIPSGFTFTAPTAPGSSPQNDSNPDADWDQRAVRAGLRPQRATM